MILFQILFEVSDERRAAFEKAYRDVFQPALSKQAWTAEVNKMITAYRAPVAPEDVATIADYLTSLKGAK